MGQISLSLCVVLILPAIAIGLDCRYQRIPNLLVLALWLPGLLWLIVTGSGLVTAGWLFAWAGLGLALVFLLPGHLLDVVGGGDVKYAAVLGFYAGPLGVLIMLAVSAPVSWLLYRFAPQPGPERRVAMAPALTVGFWVALGLLLL